MDRDTVLEQFRLFALGTDGIGGWLGPDTDIRVLNRLATIDFEPLAKVQLNQLFAFGHEAPVSDDFFSYYWLSNPPNHPYDVTRLADFDARWLASTAIVSIIHLRWGLRRLYTDGLLYFGNVRTAYRKLRALTRSELEGFFNRRRFTSEAIKARGPALPLAAIPKDDRYLISEMACKSYGDGDDSTGPLRQALSGAMKNHLARGGGAIAIRKLLDPDLLAGEFSGRQQELLFSADDVLDEAVTSQQELEDRYKRVADRFSKATPRTTKCNGQKRAAKLGLQIVEPDAAGRAFEM